jgi:NDP-sugar pyrophosphorylase family protein
MKIILPVAGKGTRLRPHTHTISHPLLTDPTFPFLLSMTESYCSV